MTLNIGGNRGQNIYIASIILKGSPSERLEETLISAAE
jgi:hypothetical protein